MESSPSIDLDVIQMFNKKFDGKYDDVRKPIIVNGLREIKPFKGCPEVELKEVIIEPKPNIHFEPEPEPEPETEP
jgi:hypothetical protein